MGYFFRFFNDSHKLSLYCYWIALSISIFVCRTDKSFFRNQRGHEKTAGVWSLTIETEMFMCIRIRRPENRRHERGFQRLFLLAVLTLHFGI